MTNQKRPVATPEAMCSLSIKALDIMQISYLNSLAKLGTAVNFIIWFSIE